MSNIKLKIRVYTHVLNRSGRGVRSPLDSLRKAAPSEAIPLSSGIRDLN